MSGRTRVEQNSDRAEQLSSRTAVMENTCRRETVCRAEHLKDRTFVERSICRRRFSLPIHVFSLPCSVALCVWTAFHQPPLPSRVVSLPFREPKKDRNGGVAGRLWHSCAPALRHGLALSLRVLRPCSQRVCQHSSVRQLCAESCCRRRVANVQLRGTRGSSSTPSRKDAASAFVYLQGFGGEGTAFAFVCLHCLRAKGPAFSVCASAASAAKTLPFVLAVRCFAHPGRLGRSDVPDLPKDTKRARCSRTPSSLALLSRPLSRLHCLVLLSFHCGQSDKWGRWEAAGAMGGCWGRAVRQAHRLGPDQKLGDDAKHVRRQPAHAKATMCHLPHSPTRRVPGEHKTNVDEGLMWKVRPQRKAGFRALEHCLSSLERRHSCAKRWLRRWFLQVQVSFADRADTDESCPQRSLRGTDLGRARPQGNARDSCAKEVPSLEMVGWVWGGGASDLSLEL